MFSLTNVLASNAPVTHRFYRGSLQTHEFRRFFHSDIIYQAISNVVSSYLNRFVSRFTLDGLVYVFFCLYPGSKCQFPTQSLAHQSIHPIVYSLIHLSNDLPNYSLSFSLVPSDPAQAFYFDSSLQCLARQVDVFVFTRTILFLDLMAFYTYNYIHLCMYLYMNLLLHLVCVVFHKTEVTKKFR